MILHAWESIPKFSNNKAQRSGCTSYIKLYMNMIHRETKIQLYDFGIRIVCYKIEYYIECYENIHVFHHGIYWLKSCLTKWIDSIPTSSADPRPSSQNQKSVSFDGRNDSSFNFNAKRLIQGNSGTSGNQQQSTQPRPAVRIYHISYLRITNFLSARFFLSFPLWYPISKMVWNEFFHIRNKTKKQSFRCNIGKFTIEKLNCWKTHSKPHQFEINGKKHWMATNN